MQTTKDMTESRIPARGCRRKNSAEHERYVGVLSGRRMVSEEDTAAETPRKTTRLLEKILTPENLNAAYRHVKKNGGAGGIDRMTVRELYQYLLKNGHEVRQSLMEGKYQPQPVRRVEIPKDNGKTRKLGIPTAADRMIQQAIAQILTPIYEPQFSDNSYGFRPGRSAHQALRKCRTLMNEGYRYAVSMDLEKFFDTVNQSKLIEILSRTITDSRVISLIHKYLRAGAVVQGKYEETREGVPQGGPLSPLCANILLNEMDKELECRGHKFVRYADDCMILCKSKRAARRTLEHLIPFIEQKLFLKVNREKTTVAYIRKVKYLGYGFYEMRKETRLRIHPKSIAKMKTQIRLLTSRSDGKSYEKRKLDLKRYIIGWINYFKLADMKTLLQKTDQWLRRRIRMCIWKRWKRVRTRYAMLRKLKIGPEWKIHEAANIRKGPWRAATNPIVEKAISEERLKRAGYTNFLDYYLVVQCG